jgi:hypothetical protein
MAAGHADYSGTPLWRKLGIAAGSRVLVLGRPEDFDDALDRIAPLPEGVDFRRRLGRDLDVVVLFVTRAGELTRRLPVLAAAIAPTGRLWVAWPKKAAGVATDVSFGLAQATGLATGLVDNKSASITDVFQGLQFVVRRRDRADR